MVEPILMVIEPSTLSTIWSLLAQISVLLLAGGCVVLLERVRQAALEWYNQRKLHPIARSVLANKKVNALLIELRTRLEADRTSVFLFHNGQTFSNKNPLWRVSCTQECCKSGISHEIGTMQNVLASLFWDGISPLFDNNCGVGVKSSIVGNQYAFLINAHEMNDSFFKRSLIARGVNQCMLTPLIDSRKEVVGYISADFCNCAAPDMQKATKEIIETAGLIHFALTEV